MRVVKLFASDLDGTLLNALHKTDPVILASLRRLRAAGAHFSIATGRTLRSNRERADGSLPLRSTLTSPMPRQ